MIRKIAASKDDITTFLDENSLSHKVNILLAIEKIEQLNMALFNLKDVV